MQKGYFSAYAYAGLIKSRLFSFIRPMGALGGGPGFAAANNPDSSQNDIVSETKSELSYLLRLFSVDVGQFLG